MILIFTSTLPGDCSIGEIKFPPLGWSENREIGFGGEGWDDPIEKNANAKLKREG